MPFGDHTQTYVARVDRDEFGGGKPIRARLVSVPEAEPPTWWSEYLVEEWKRSHGLEQEPRDRRTKWQRSQDAYCRQLRTWQLSDDWPGRFQVWPNQPSPKPHPIWGDV